MTDQIENGMVVGADAKRDADAQEAAERKNKLRIAFDRIASELTQGDIMEAVKDAPNDLWEELSESWKLKPGMGSRIPFLGSAVYDMITAYIDRLAQDEVDDRR